MQDLKPAAPISESGRVVITSLHRPEDTPAALQNLLNNLREAGITCPDKPEVAITNMVCSCDLGYPLNLARIMIAFMDHKRVACEPEFLPGLVCRIFDLEIIFLLFRKDHHFRGRNMEESNLDRPVLRKNSVLLRDNPEKKHEQGSCSCIRSGIQAGYLKEVYVERKPITIIRKT